MKTYPSLALRRLSHSVLAAFLIAPFLFGPLTLFAAEPAPALVDDFAAADHTATGGPRLVITDQQMGGKSQATATCADGVMQVTGQLAPGRGMPGFVSIPLMLTTDGQPQDLSAYEGVRLRVKVEQGTLSVQVSSTEIQNFDYHTSAPVVRRPGEFQEVRIPFKAMQRAWSEQTTLNLATVTSLNLVAAGMAPGAFAYAIDEIGFY